jgi:hypothetical protein
MRWLRLYDDVLDDPKVQQLSPATFKHWINLLCLAAKTNPRGTLPNFAAISFRLRLTDTKTASLLDELLRAGLLDKDANGTLSPHNWAGRQRVSDDAAVRVRKHRESVSGNVTGNDVVTLQKRSVDTDTETEPEQNPLVIPPFGGDDTHNDLEAAPEPTTPEPRSRPKRTIKTAIPEDFTVPPEVWAEIKAEQGMTDEQLAFETRKFSDSAIQHARRYADWVRAWKAWMRSNYCVKPPLNGLPPPQPAFTPGSLQELLEWDARLRDPTRWNEQMHRNYDRNPTDLERAKRHVAAQIAAQQGPTP